MCYVAWMIAIRRLAFGWLVLPSCKKRLSHFLAMACRLQLFLVCVFFSWATSQEVSTALDRDDECQSTAGECSLNALQLRTSGVWIGPCEESKVTSEACNGQQCMFSCTNFFGGKNYLSCPAGVQPQSLNCRQYGCSYNCGSAGGVACSDDDGLGSDCETWAARGECSKNPNYMHVKCKASCGLCVISQPEPQPPQHQPQPLPPQYQPQQPPQYQPQPQFPSGWCRALFGGYGFSPSQCRKSYGGSWYQWICSSNGQTYFCDSSCNHCNT